MTPADSCSQLAGTHTVPGAWPPEDLERVAQCPVCGGSERTLLHDHLTDRVFFCAPDEWTLYTCSGCGSAYLDPRPPRASIGRAYAEYFTHRENNSTDRASRFRRLRRAAANGHRNWRFGTHLEPTSKLWVFAAALPASSRSELAASGRYLLKKHAAGARLLDIGAGNGDLLALARSAGWVGQGVEPDPKAAAVCRARNLHVRIGGIEQFEQERECFDYITISHVIEHVHDPRNVLECAFGLLKPMGCLYVDTPNIDALGHRQYGVSWRGLEPPRHLVIFSWNSPDRLLRDVGFTRIVYKPRLGIYADLTSRSQALQRGNGPYGVHVSLRDKIVGRVRDTQVLSDYNKSDFITLLAYKASPRQ